MCPICATPSLFEHRYEVKTIAVKVCSRDTPRELARVVVDSKTVTTAFTARSTRETVPLVAGTDLKPGEDTMYVTYHYSSLSSLWCLP